MDSIDKRRLEQIMLELIDAKSKLEKSISYISATLEKQFGIKPVSLDIIGNFVFGELRVTKEQVMSGKRSQTLVRARQFFSVIAIESYGYSIENVSKYIKRDRSTYYNFRDKHQNYMETEEGYSKLYKALIQKITDYEKSTKTK